MPRNKPRKLKKAAGVMPCGLWLSIKSTALTEDYQSSVNFLQSCLRASKIHLQVCKVCRLRLLLDENAVSVCGLKPAAL
ncbi:MAG: hypothetical protein IJL89_09595, partial [Firmicutes bacterium]|nr:hypothetical protein [Bacillota bacterium]